MQSLHFMHLDKKLMRQIFFLFIILLTFSFATYCQTKNKLKTTTDSIHLLQKIVRDGQLISTSGVGYANTQSRQWYSFAFLLSLTTKDELLKMVQDNSPCLRLYAYIGLIHFKYSDIADVKKYLSADTSQISSVEGCILHITTIGKAVNNITNWYAERQMNDFLLALQNDKKYKSQLFQNIVNQEQIKRYPKHQ